MIYPFMNYSGVVGWPRWMLDNRRCYFLLPKNSEFYETILILNYNYFMFGGRYIRAIYKNFVGCCGR